MSATASTSTPTRRLFADVLTEWVDEIEQRMRDAPAEQLPLLVDLGLHAQRLMAEANILGQIEAHKAMRESGR